MKKLSKRKKNWIERTVGNDRSYKLYLYNRFVLFVLSVLLQIVFSVGLLYLLTYHSKAGIALQTIIAIVELLVILHLVNKSNPATRLSWILLIAFFPFVGVPMYLVYGEGKALRKMRKKIVQVKEENETAWKEVYGKTEETFPVFEQESVSHYLSFHAGYPIYRQGDVTYFKSGEEAFPVMLAELKKAERFILLEYFIVEGGKMWNQILRVLLEKAEQGVQIRMIYDDFGCMMTLPPKYDRYLESLHKNIRCVSFNKVIPIFDLRMNNRDHRKLLIIDGKVGFTGGINLADEYIGEKIRFGYWKDSCLKISGASVNSFTKMFFYLWNASRKDKERLQEYLLPLSAYKEENNTGGIQPYDDSPLDRTHVGETVYFDMVNQAKKYVYIFTPYLVLDDSMRMALCLAAMRGVVVRIVTPGVPDKKMVYRLTRANYETLLDAGVKIYEYTPGFIHSKSMVCDDRYAVVGTINLDYRSLYLHFEDAVYFSDCDAVWDVKRDAEETFAVSKLYTKENFHRSKIGSLTDSVLRLFETMF